MCRSSSRSSAWARARATAFPRTTRRTRPKSSCSGTRSSRASTPRPQIGLACIRIGLRLDRFRPLADARRDAAPLGSRPSVPADLLHVVIELHGVARRVEHVGAVVDAGSEGGRNLDEAAAALL